MNVADANCSLCAPQITEKVLISESAVAGPNIGIQCPLARLQQEWCNAVLIYPMMYKDRFRIAAEVGHDLLAL